MLKLYEKIVDQISQNNLEYKRLETFKETVISKGGYPNQYVQMDFIGCALSYKGNTHSEKSTSNKKDFPTIKPPSLNDD